MIEIILAVLGIALGSFSLGFTIRGMLDCNKEENK